ncbi:MAG: hypothetical protein AVDCRST_MAG51-3304 [uncultured Ramlibacter sp.]|uniref:Uncharacterized protein n=1 Tax=uncultured Ramlibacter sp. TaxID=260755 RepID=A0A6J4QE50_9BURK|nr:MAG: hypothetical protein AVDCRST_MAG51-3304 [uncultured Ramlibacter sp.]
MARHKSPGIQRGAGPQGANAPENRSGQGSGSALDEMLRRQAQDPKPGLGQNQPDGREAAVQAAPPPRKHQN